MEWIDGRGYYIMPRCGVGGPREGLGLKGRRLLQPVCSFQAVYALSRGFFGWFLHTGDSSSSLWVYNEVVGGWRGRRGGCGWRLGGLYLVFHTDHACPLETLDTMLCQASHLISKGNDYIAPRFPW